MRRALFFLLIFGIVMAGCGGGVTESVTSGTTVPAAPTTTATAAPATTSLPTTTTLAPTTTTALPPVDALPTGLYCRDLAGAGYEYADAVTYWVREGRPDRLDADFDSIPCETVYSPDVVVAFWGEPLPTSTTLAPVTASDLEQRLAEQFPQSAASEMWRIPDAWSCALVVGSSGAGSAYKCMPTEIGEGQWPILTALILDDAGTVAISQAGVFYTVLNADLIEDELGTGLFCRDLYADGSWLVEELPTPELEYFGAVLYWFVEGRPARMDADGNGIPCETLVPASVVDALWHGGWIEG